MNETAVSGALPKGMSLDPAHLGQCMMEAGPLVRPDDHPVHALNSQIADQGATQQEARAPERRGLAGNNRSDTIGTTYAITVVTPFSGARQGVLS
jgi:hypothetical protein